MQQAPLPLVQIILRYDAPLQRYARRLVKDDAIAAAIVKIVFEQVYEVNSFKIDEPVLAKQFKTFTQRLATVWLFAQAHPNPQNS